MCACVHVCCPVLNGNFLNCIHMETWKSLDSLPHPSTKSLKRGKIFQRSFKKEKVCLFVQVKVGRVVQFCTHKAGAISFNNSIPLCAATATRRDQGPGPYAPQGSRELQK